MLVIWWKRMNRIYIIIQINIMFKYIIDWYEIISWEKINEKCKIKSIVCKMKEENNFKYRNMFYWKIY